MDTKQKIKAELEAYRASKQSTSPVGDTFGGLVSNAPKRDIKSELEAYRASKNAPETREGRISQGLPVGTGDNVKPTFAGDVVRGIVKPFVKLGASVKAIGEVAQGKTPTGITSEFLGNVRPIGEGFDVTQGLTPENTKAIKDSVGTGLDIASNIPVAKGLGIAKNVVAQPFKKTVFQTAKNVGKEGLVQGGLSGAGTSLQEDKGVAETIGNTLFGTAAGGAGGFVLGGAGARASRAFSKTPADFTSQLIDKDIRKAYQGVTGDIEKLDKIAYGSRKGLELLANESPNIKIPDSKAPLGSSATKQFDIKKANGNEFISAVNKLRQKVVGNARTAVKEASAKGFTLKTDDAKRVITEAVNNGDITPATASRLYKQIDNTGGNAEKIFDWVQEVNQKYKNRFEKGTIDDMATSRIANDIAEGFRKELNTITDRTGYAESMSNIKDLERLLVSVAKKANKNINFGDITSEAGLDAGISLLTGNPAYMARTLASGVFKGIVGKVRNTQGLRSVKSAIKGVSKIPNETKMPSSGLKQSRLMLPAPKAGTPNVQNNVPINMPSRKAIEQGTEIVPRDKPNLNLSNARKIEPDLTLKGEDAKIQDASIAKYNAQQPKLVKDYIQTNGKVVNTDEARKLFKDVGYRGSNSPAVQEASSAVAKDAWEELLRTSKSSDSLLYAGGSGTGKTSAVKNILASDVADAGAILDGNLSTMKSAEARINESIKAGKYPTIVYVYRDPVDAWVNGVIKRMKGNVEEGGRVVPLSVFLDNHKGSYEVVKTLLNDSANGIKYDVKMVDNSLGKGRQALLERSKFDTIKYSDKLESELLNQTKKLYEKGTITKEQYQALIK